tara:strand:- start:577 stop:1572 length:996 start_codon:yes stop_codon:yes gene_type:complete
MKNLHIYLNVLLKFLKDTDSKNIKLLCKEYKQLLTENGYLKNIYLKNNTSYEKYIKTFCIHLKTIQNIHVSHRMLPLLWIPEFKKRLYINDCIFKTLDTDVKNQIEEIYITNKDNDFIINFDSFPKLKKIDLSFKKIYNPANVIPPNSLKLSNTLTDIRFYCNKNGYVENIDPIIKLPNLITLIANVVIDKNIVFESKNIKHIALCSDYPILTKSENVNICLNSKSIILKEFDYNNDIVNSLIKWSENLHRVEYRRIFRNNANPSSLLRHYGNYLGFYGLFSFDKNLLKKLHKNIRYKFDKWRLNHMHHDFYYQNNIIVETKKDTITYKVC